MKKIVLYLLCLLISIFSVAQVPVNDECSGALAVTPSSDASPGASVASNNTGATQSMTGCSGTLQNDIWFKFTATSTRHRVNIATNDNINPVLEVFSGTCGSLQSLGCGIVGPEGIYNRVHTDLANLTPGATYYYRMFYRFNNAGTSITTNVITLPTAAVNDECSSAVALSVNTDNSCTNSYGGFLEFATQSRPSCIQNGNAAKDVWFRFVATSTAHRITVTPFNFNNTMFEVFSGTCNSLTSLACVNTGAVFVQDIGVLNNLIAGNTYYVRVYSDGGGNTIYDHFSICISTANSFPDNDDCSGALAVTPSPDTSPGSSVFSYNFGATQSMAGCIGTAEDDIWFKFTATSAKHRVNVTTTDNINPVVELFSGTCGSLQSVGCKYDSPNFYYCSLNADFANLIPGAAYYYRAYGRNNNNNRTNFTTYVTTTSAASLPITMAEFTVKADNGKNVLRWQTLSETNNSGFEIQYSRDGIHFDSLHFVASNAGSGNSSVTQSYLYEHNVASVEAGKVYYRLKQIDYDLHDHYSNVISAEIVSTQNISILPNPVGRYIDVRMPQTKGYQFVVYDYVGRIYKQGVLQNNEIKVPELKSGMYILRLINDHGMVVVLKFLKL